MAPVDEKKLLATTDAMVWAQEFCAAFDVTPKGCSPTEGDDPVGLMVGWFANAMTVAEHDAYDRGMAAASALVGGGEEGGSGGEG